MLIFLGRAKRARLFRTFAPLSIFGFLDEITENSGPDVIRDVEFFVVEDQGFAVFKLPRIDK